LYLGLLRDGKLTQYPDLAGMSVDALVEDREREQTDCRSALDHGRHRQEPSEEHPFEAGPNDRTHAAMIGIKHGIIDFLF